MENFLCHSDSGLVFVFYRMIQIIQSNISEIELRQFNQEMQSPSIFLFLRENLDKMLHISNLFILSHFYF